MSRPSQNLDLKLLAAGKAIIEEQGLTGLSLRAVAKKAGVNLGMFHYHFRNKQDFARQVLQSAYEEFFADFSLEVERGVDPLEGLRLGLLRLARFVSEHRRLVLAMMHDAAAGHPEPLDFVKRNFHRHILVILSLIRQGQRRGLLVKCPYEVALPSLVGATILPSLAVGLAERVAGRKFMGLPVALVRFRVLSEKAVDTRVRLALRGLMVRPESYRWEAK